MTLVSPLGVVVDEYVVLHCQFEVWDLLTHPPRESTHMKASPDHTPDTVTDCQRECGGVDVGGVSGGGKVAYRMVSMIS